MSDLRMNERAWVLVDRTTGQTDELRIALHVLPCGARVLDAGIQVAGGYAAGLLLTELCMGGLGHVAYTPVVIDGEQWPGVQVWTDFPAISCMASQYAGWAINPDRFFAMGSGPLRARARVEKELYAKLKYSEDSSRGIASRTS